MLECRKILAAVLKPRREKKDFLAIGWLKEKEEARIEREKAGLLLSPGRRIGH